MCPNTQESYSKQLIPFIKTETDLSYKIDVKNKFNSILRPATKLSSGISWRNVDTFLLLSDFTLIS